MFSFSSQLNHNSLWFTSCKYDFEIIQHIHNSSKGEQIWIFISLQTHSVVSFCHFCDLIQIIYLQWILCTLWCVDAICSKVITIFFCHFLTFYIVYSFITSLAIMHASTESHRQMSTLLMFKTKIDIYCWHFDTSFSISFFEFWMSCMLWITLKPRNIFSYLNIFGITK